MPSKSYRYLFEQDWDELRSKINLATSYKEKWTSLIPLFEQISAQNAVFIMVWNIKTNRIVYAVDKKEVLGHDISKFLAPDWFEFSFGNMHPNFAQAVAIMQHEGTKYLVEESNGNPEKFLMCLEALYKKSNGKYFHLFQQSLCIEKDKDNNPYFLLSYVQDITYLKKSGTVNFFVITPDEIKWWNYNFDKNCLVPVQPLSKQEKKILSLLSDGKSSKQIAEELSISHHTVDTHRRNLLEKTNCVDTTGMITYLKLVGLL